MFESLDYLYMPSRDVAADARYFTEVLGGELVFAIEEWRTRVAMVRMSDTPPDLLFTDHLEGERPILIYRVADLAATITQLESEGWEREGVFEIPQGPCTSFHTIGGHRLAIYQPTRPEVISHFTGRRDF
jgi:hypothetical protein